ncbi:MAG: leucine-rich repeat protein, partial [Clostridia bacterium]|nr:leucine-rich repeat protein [Clostridia bacterium]
MTKKSLTLLLVLMLSIMLVFAFASCGSNDTPVDTSTDTGTQGCNHSATTTIKGYAPTCTKTGLTDGKRCSLCNEVIFEQQVISALGHIEINIPGFLPTCTDDGLTDGKKCTVCETVILAQEVIDSTGHSYSETYEFETSCGGSNISYSAQICNNCGHSSISDGETVLHPHSFECYSREATCTLDGIKNGFRCKNCSYIAAEIKINALGHNYGDYVDYNKSYHYQECSRCKLKNYEQHNCEEFTTVKEPNCYEEGREVGVCTLCDREVENVLPIKHIWNNGTVTTDATCISKGEKLYTCTICSTTKTEEINETSHPYDAGLTTKEPTCIQTGLVLYTCTYCSTTKTEIINKKAHPYDNGVVTNEPTCTETGSKLYTCTFCSETKIETLSALGHKWYNGTTTVEANCYQTGNIHYLCQRCDAEKDEIVPKLHSFDKGTTLQEASCTEVGKIRYTCTICSVYDDVTTSIKHNTSYVSAKDETCTEDGCKSHYYCADCQTYYTKASNSSNRFEYDGRTYSTYYTYSYTETTFENVNIPATGHDFSGSYEKTEEKHYLLCKNGCGARSNEATHTLVEETAFERTNDGTQYIYSYNSYLVCHICNYQEVVDSLEFAHEHYGVEVIDGAEPTCTQNGITTGLACSVVGCDEIYIEQETISALGHNYVNAICTRCGLNSKLGTTGLTYELNSDGTAYICTGIGTATTPFIVIGSEYKGLPVTEIKANAFRKNYNIVSVVIPSTITTIGNSAFYNCHKLVEVYNLSSLTVANDTTNGYVGNYALDIYTDILTQSKLVTTNNGYIFYLGQTNYLMGYVGNETKLVFPNMFMGKEYSIYKYAFYDNDKITSITLGLKIKALGDHAFYGCSYLTEINFNATAMDDLSKDNYVFFCAGEDRNGIKVTIGKNVTRIPAYLFNPYEYSSYSPKITSVEFEEESVCESIGNYAFEDCDSLTSVTIPNSVTTIGSYAFSYCDSLTSITIPNSVISIGYGAFENCTSLKYNEYNNGYYLGNENNPYLVLVKAKDKFITSCDIHENTRFIHSNAFYNCTSLTSITIPEGVTSIGEDAFSGCTNLTEINFNAIALDDLSYNNHVFSNAGKDGNGIKVTIDKNVTKIPARLFYSVKITSVEFEEGSVCESIGNYAFYNCDSLTSVTIPSSITSIGSDAFYNCTNLTEIKFKATAMDDLGSNKYVFYNAGKDGNGIKVTIGKNVTKIPAYLFHPYSSSSYSSKITSVVFEEGSVCESIGSYAFYNCDSLTSVTIPSSVTSIGYGAFSGCYKLAEVYNLSSLTITVGSTSNGYVGYYAKVIHTSLEEKSILETVNDYIFMTWEGKCYLMGYLGNDKELTLPESYNGSNYEIYQYFFYNRDKITKITIPNSVTTIGNDAFYNCTSLTSITIPNSVTTIGNDAFYNCTSLTSITIPNSVTTIGSYAFYNCDSLKYNEYDNGYYLGNENNPYLVLVKAKDKSIISCAIHENTRFIHSDAFYNCTSLTSITIPNSVTSIGICAFYKCTSLTSVTIPNGVKSIGNRAFYNCTSINRINFNAIAMDDLSYDNYVFYNAGKDGNGIKVTIGKNVTKIPAKLFYQDSSSSYSPKITSVEFEDGSICTSIGSYAFTGCDLLTSITIPEGVTSIRNHAFNGCDLLTSIIIPNSVMSI